MLEASPQREDINEVPADDNFELPVDGFKGTPDEIERQWFERVYKGRGDVMAQLTPRAVIMGALLGGVLSLTNIYIGLKSGWAFGVAITACILSYAIWTLFYQIGLAKSKMTILENNCMQSTASSAGYSTGGTLVSAFAAYIMINNHSLSTPVMLAWIFFLAVLGVTMAIPMKRQMINIEQLRFPSGIAAAETLQALHSHGAKGIRAARALGISAIAAGISKIWAEGIDIFEKSPKVYQALEPFSLGSLIEKFNLATFGKTWVDRTVMLSWEPIFLAAGVLTGLRVSASIFLGGCLCWGLFVPLLHQQGVTDAVGYRELVSWTLWGGVACMVTSGLLSFAFQWRSMLRAFGDVAKMFSPRGRKDDAVAVIETPSSWFFAGQLFSLVALAWLAKMTFDMPIWQSVLAVFLSFFLALVACRVTGETDATPIGAMGKVTQLIFGAVNPGNMNVNLMSANITAGSAGSAADLLTDLKSGYLLGANPRKQFLAQFSGIFIGTVVTVFAFQTMVPNAQALGTDKFPAPSAQAWKAVALALSKGLEEMEPIKVWSIAIGGLVGIILPVLSKILSKRAPKYEPWVPSPAGIGLAWTFHWFYSMLFFVGAIIGYLCERGMPKVSKEYAFPVASGIIAGDALMGVILIFTTKGIEMFQQVAH